MTHTHDLRWMTQQRGGCVALCACSWFIFYMVQIRWMDGRGVLLSYPVDDLTTQQCHSKKEGPNGGMLLFLAAGLHFKKFDFLP